MKSAIALGASLALAPMTALAGDPAAGEQAFNQCQACHVVQNEEGEVLAGRNGRQGPNLYGIIGRQAGIIEGFRYGNSIVEAGEQGLIWDEEAFIAYVMNPNGFLREFLDNNRARGNMAFQVRSDEAAADLYAFLATFSPMDEDTDEDDAEEAAD